MTSGPEQQNLIIIITVLYFMHKLINTNVYHDKYGHIGEYLLRKTLRHLNLEATGIMKRYDACQVAKVRVMDAKKKTDTRSEIPSKRMYINFTGYFNPSL